MEVFLSILYSNEKRKGMLTTVVQRFRECQNLLVSITTNLRAIANLNSQRVAVEEALRRHGPSTPTSSSSPNDENMDMLCCSSCTAPLGILRAFPESTIEVVIAQHTEDVNSLLRSIGSSQQVWLARLQKAKESVSPRVPTENIHNNNNSSIHGSIGKEAHELVGAHALLSVLADMHAWLQELVFALRADLAHPPRAVELSVLLMRGVEDVPVASLENMLEQLPERVEREWDACRSRHMVDEAWIALSE